MRDNLNIRLLRREAYSLLEGKPIRWPDGDRDIIISASLKTKVLKVKLDQEELEQILHEDKKISWIEDDVKIIISRE